MDETNYSPNVVTTDIRKNSITGIINGTIEGLGCIFPYH